jgi:hypothetical protein
VNDNEFQSTAIQHTPETSSVVLAAREKALVEARYTVAIARPRDLDKAREKIISNCRRIGFAMAAIYRKPIGKDRDKWPTGPSIRFAEAAIQAMGNVTVETITVYDDAEKRIVRVTVTDLEANIPYSQDVTIQKTVERKFLKQGDTPISSRKNSYGDTTYLMPATDDDILNKQNALISKAIRTLGLRLVPGDLIDEGLMMCRKTQADGDADPNAAKRRVIDAFGAIGVTVEQIKEYLGHAGATLNPKEREDLLAIHAAIKDGETTWQAIMEARNPEPPPSGTPEDLASLQAAAAATAASRKAGAAT